MTTMMASDVNTYHLGTKDGRAVFKAFGALELLAVVGLFTAILQIGQGTDVVG